MLITQHAMDLGVKSDTLNIYVKYTINSYFYEEQIDSPRTKHRECTDHVYRTSAARQQQPKHSSAFVADSQNS